MAAGRDPDPAVDVLLHSTLLRTCREAAAHDRERGEARISEIGLGENCLSADGLAVPAIPAKKLIFISAPASILQTARRD